MVFKYALPSGFLRLRTVNVDGMRALPYVVEGCPLYKLGPDDLLLLWCVKKPKSVVMVYDRENAAWKVKLQEVK